MGEPLNLPKIKYYSLAAPPSHPVSRRVHDWLGEQDNQLTDDLAEPLHWHEATGQGVEAMFGPRSLRLGSKDFIGRNLEEVSRRRGGRIFANQRQPARLFPHRSVLPARHKRSAAFLSPNRRPFTCSPATTTAKKNRYCLCSARKTGCGFSKVHRITSLCQRIAK